MLQLHNKEMVTFSGITIESDEIVDFLKQEVQLKSMCHQILCRQIVVNAAAERDIVVTPQEIQTDADQQRFQKKLESATSTFAWLADELIEAKDWEQGIRDRLLSRKLADALFGREVEQIFAERRIDFEQISLYRIQVPYRQLAQELFYQIEENEISFYEAAHLYDLDERRRLQCGYEGKPYRWTLQPDLCAIIFSSKTREVLGPIQVEQGFDLLMVEEFIPAELTAETRREIGDRLFKDWLESELNYLIHNQSGGSDRLDLSPLSHPGEDRKLNGT
jgi:parvulin-like peptidyl-prolyl isomerase